MLSLNASGTFRVQKSATKHLNVEKKADTNVTVQPPAQRLPDKVLEYLGEVYFLNEKAQN